MGLVQMEWQSLLSIGRVFTEHGEHASALDMFNQADALLEHRTLAGLPGFFAYRAATLAHLGQMEEARADIAQAHEWLETNRTTWHQTVVFAAEATVAALAGELTEAGRLLERAGDINDALLHEKSSFSLEIERARAVFEQAARGE